MHLKAGESPESNEVTEVFLDGVLIPEVYELDTRERWLTRYARDERGQPIAIGNAWQMERLTGTVLVKFKDGSQVGG